MQQLLAFLHYYYNELPEHLLLGCLHKKYCWDEHFSAAATKKIREKKYLEINLNPKKKKVSKIKNSSKIREQETYKPLVFWLKNYIKEKYKEDSEAFDTSAQTLNNYLRTNLDNFSIVEEKINEKVSTFPDNYSLSDGLLYLGHPQEELTTS